MTRDKAESLAGSRRALGRILGISHQAIGKWRVVPTHRLARLVELRPEWFTRGRA